MTADQVMRREYFQTQFRNDEFWKGFLNNKNACFYADKSTSFECLEMYDDLWGGFIFQSTEDSDNSKSTLIKINQVYKATDDGFDGAMRDAFDRYGSYCCLDAMMRVLNTSGLPYLLAIVVFDETGSMLTAIEGLVFLESKVGYRFSFKEMLASRYGWINTILSTQ
jgi:hypothetical protein